MLDLLRNFDFSLNVILWIISLSLLTLSLLICLGLCVRRLYRNNITNSRLEEQSEFETSLNLALQKDKTVFHETQYSFKKTTSINEILLRYFRTLKGERADTLRQVIENLQIEKHILTATKTGTMGRRMEAMQILSYLDTQDSLQTIHQGLYAPNKYVRLTAARCLTRRNAAVFLNDIIDSINSAFPNEEKLLADIIYHFGFEATDVLESYVNSDCNDCIKAACLEALVLIMPPKTSLNIEALLESSDEKIRAAAISLSEITPHQSKNDALIKALGDSSVKVKIRATKIAGNTRRIDTISPLYQLSQDPLLWVRYWSIKAIWNTGRQGRKLVETMGQGNDSSARMAREVALECLSLEGGLTH